MQHQRAEASMLIETAVLRFRRWCDHISDAARWWAIWTPCRRPYQRGSGAGSRGPTLAFSWHRRRQNPFRVAGLFRLHSFPECFMTRAGSRKRPAILARKEQRMIRTLMLSAALVAGLATAASAGVTPSQLGVANNSIVKVAEGCGRGWWRSLDGRCHPMARGAVCPRGYHLGPDRARCWPN